MASAFADNNTSRKRSRNDYFTSSPARSTTFSTSTNWSTSFSPSTLSPVPLANSRYLLEDGLDTPTAERQDIRENYEHASSNYEFDFRRGRPYNEFQLQPSDHSNQLPAALARESNGRPRVSSKYTGNNGWSSAVFTTLTGAAGKVWSFCRAGATFKGFFAGGGQGYTMETPVSLRQENRSPSDSIWEDDDRSATPMPGEYPKIPYIENYMDSPQEYDTSARASKKAKHSYVDAGNLSKSWIMVNDTPSRRKLPTQSTASPASMRRPASRAATRRPSQIPSPLSTSRPASAAGLRSPVLPRPRANSRTGSRDYVPTTPKSVRPSLQCEKPASPIARETAEHLKKIKRMEKQEDRELRDFNKRLQDMIREGKEALRSKVEIETDGTEEDLW
ncbi:MAG: hypothetical protein MMC23_007604 [Stictis urceolatum]|nr:hypothetical protein [Stictis urceolata]